VIDQQPYASLLELKLFLDQAREFKLNYYVAEKRFQQSDALWQTLSTKALDWLEDQFDRDRNRLNQAEKSFFASWYQSREYHQLEGQLHQLIENSRKLLLKTYKRPPSLREVEKAVRLTARSSQLAGLLSTSHDEARAWLAQGRRLPIGVNARLRAGFMKSARRR
jgi:hypothetical protein